MKRVDPSGEKVAPYPEVVVQPFDILKVYPSTGKRGSFFNKRGIPIPYIFAILPFNGKGLQPSPAM